MVTWPPSDPFWRKFSFFMIGHLAIILRAKFQVSSFSRCRDMRGPKIHQNGQVTPWLPDLTKIFIFLRHCTSQLFCVPNFKFLASAVAEIYRGPRISKNGHVTPCLPLLPEIFIFYDGALRDYSACQIWCFRFHPLSQNSQKWSRDSLATPFNNNSHFFKIGHLAIILHTKFQISSFSRWRDM